MIIRITIYSMKMLIHWRGVRIKMAENLAYVHMHENQIAPMIDIIMLVYNHAEFVGEAINSILMQQTRYSYRIKIGEDCSTDSSRQIIMDFYKRYPDKIELYLWKKNVGGNKNAIELIKGCKGKYIAFLEGDDYWTDSLKLEKQVSFLEKHKNYIGAVHNVRCVDRNGQLLHRDFGLYPIYEEHIYGKEQAKRLEIAAQTASLLFRNIFKDWARKNLEEFFMGIGNGDVKVNVLLGLKGDVYYFKDIMADHRRIFEGDSWTAKNYDKNMLWFCYQAKLFLQSYMKKSAEIIVDTKAMLEESQIRLLCKPNKENLYTYWKFLRKKLWENVL